MKAKNKRAIVSIVTNDYFHQAMVLAHSVNSFEKKSDFIVFVVGYDENDCDYQQAGFTVLDAKLLNKKKWNQFVFQYHPSEVCCALKPQALLYLLRQYERVIYLDTDIKLFAEMERGWEALKEFDLSLTPHNSTPIPVSGIQPSRFIVKMAGIFNAGYVGASRGSISFLEWWWQQTQYNCVMLIHMGVYLDQFYLNYAITLVEHLHVMKDPTYNVASWNQHERKLEKKENRYFVNKRPLTCFHFSGWIKERAYSTLETRSKDLLFGELFFDLFCEYHNDLLLEENKLSKKKYPYAHFQDGEKIDLAWREWMRRDIPELRNIENPFLLNSDQREKIEEIMVQRPRDFRPNLDRELVLSSAIPYELLYLTAPLSLTT